MDLFTLFLVDDMYVSCNLSLLILVSVAEISKVT